MALLEASVQYNDLKGTSAADLSDYSDLNDFARNYGINADKYIICGVALYSTCDQNGSVSIICKDRELNRFKSISLPEMSISIFFNLFKRFNFVLLNRDIDYNVYAEEIDLSELLNEE